MTSNCSSISIESQPRQGRARDGAGPVARLAALAALSLAVGAPFAAGAQQVQPPAGPSPPEQQAAPAAAGDSLQEVVITGSRFRVPNADSPAPITIVGAADLMQQGATKAEDLLVSLPQANAGLTDSGVGISQTPLTGTATVDLRGIGAFRTLVLMNGNRINPGDAVNPSADLHTIPEILIKRVEVLTGGASSIYGSDAIAGVVNFVMDTDYSGAKIVAQGSGFYANNNNRDLQAIMQASGVNTPSGSAFDGGTYNLTGVYGSDFAGSSGHVVVYGGYRHSAAILASSRDFSSCTLTEATPTSYGCLLDGTTPAGQFVDPIGNAYTLDASGSGLRPFTAADGYNFTAPETLRRPDTRYTAGLFAHLRFSDYAESYLEGQFMHDYTTLQYEPSGSAPSGVGPLTYAVPCNDPLLSASEIATLCTANGLAATDVAQIGIGRRNVEGGVLQDAFRHASYRFLLGLKGRLSGNWTYDANLQYGKVTAHEQVSNDISIARLTNALYVVGVNGTPTCQSVVDGTDPACVPYDIWRTGGVTPAALAYVTAGGANDGYATRSVVTAETIGDLGAYGLKTPWSADPFGLALGVQYRNEAIANQPDAAMSAGDLMYASNVLYGSLPTQGSFHVSEAFAEVKAPIAKGRPFAESLNLNLADRYARYAPQGGVNAYNVGVDWAPIRTIRFRSSLGRAIRAANGHELFLAQSAGLQQIADPCSGATPAATQAQCALTGVSATDYGHIPAANSVNVVTGGNPGLAPEKADTLTVGVVLTHFEQAPSLLLSVDYWRIRVRNYIGSIPASTSLSQCLATGNPVFCSLVVRGPGGSLTSGRILATRANTGSYGASGIDVAGQYDFSLGAAGRLNFTFNGSALLDNPIAVNPSAPLADCKGLYGPSCSGEGPTSPIQSWRHNLRTTWTRGPLDASLNWRHIGAMNFEGTSAYFAGEKVSPIDSHVAAYDYFDLTAGYRLRDVDVRAGINNLFGKQPPIVGYGSNPLLLNGNLLAGIYDPFGRELFAELTVNF